MSGLGRNDVLQHDLIRMNSVRSSKPSSRSYIRTHSAPAAIGPYSQAVLVKDTLYCSGQIAIDPETSHLVTESLEAALVTSDGTLAYPVRDGIPVLLIDQAISLRQSEAEK